LQSDTEKVSEDNIDLQVFRRIFDGHPIKVETLIKLRVSGKQRNISLESVLLDNFIAIELDSDLAVQLEESNKLKVQLRPGEWSIRVIGRAPADLQQLTIDGEEQRIQPTDNQLNLTLKPGKQEVVVNWREPSAQKLYYKFPSVNLGLPSVNAHADIKLPRSRWVIMANGPTLGPAVLFWGVLLALLIFSII
jgi:hypothetical protein